MKIDLTQKYMRDFFHYDPETGVMRRTARYLQDGRIVQCNRPIQAKTAYGYLQVNVGGRPYVIHRLAFLYMQGSLPQFDVDHVNGDRTDNRWVNLRLVSREANLRNAGIRDVNTSGYPGVSPVKSRGLWHAYIHIGKGERVNLGYFKTLDLAVAARRGAEALLGYHPNHGKRKTWAG